MELAEGTSLGPYTILSPVGAGGMGEVYRARDSRLDRDVAIKVLPEGFSNDASALKRFRREAKALASLSHPNILTIYDIGEQDGMSFRSSFSPVELNTAPMFDLLGTPRNQKELKLYDTDHIPPRNEFIKETLAWLDRYLGPTR